MKKIFYISIVLVTLSLNSCREQDEMVQINDTKAPAASKTTALESGAGAAYSSFDSSNIQQGDPVKPPRD